MTQRLDKINKIKGQGSRPKLEPRQKRLKVKQKLKDMKSNLDKMRRLQYYYFC